MRHLKAFFVLFILMMSPLQGSEDSGWIDYQDNEWSVKFPAEPEVISKSNSFEQYVAVDTSNFPIIVYSLGIIKQKKSFDIENFINDILLSESENVIIWHEISQDEDHVILDIIRMKKNSKMLQKEHFIITQNVVYQLMTLCYPIGVENHHFFINSFSTTF